ncbi:MAG: cyclase family protein [Pyrinomonadaceae bacterium]
MKIDLNQFTPIDISIPLRFNGMQPNAYGVEGAMSEAVQAGSLVGDTRQGGSVNFELYTFIPHCNGTHTECVGHITDARISVRECLQDVIVPAILVTVEPEARAGAENRITSRELIRKVKPPATAGGADIALVVRTRPNDDSKLTARYGEGNVPSYFTSGAMEYIVECGFKHLLVDIPSIDRLFDGGKLTNHRIFWNVEPESREVNADTRINSTITEMIYVPNDIEDGEYLLNLQIAPFESDCAPSRPILLRAT